MDKQKITCAVVVTYNRKKLLLECLESLRKQTTAVDGICIIDNASTDDTPLALLEEGYLASSPPAEIDRAWEQSLYVPNLINGRNIRIHYVRMRENAGGAGGFGEGMKRAFEFGYEWIWIMDDDVVPASSALEKLVSATDIVGEFGFLASKVIGLDGRAMNVPAIDLRSPSGRYPEWGCFLDQGIVQIRDATFVSLLFPCEIVKRAGLPLSEIFIWGDDAEYTMRVTNFIPAYLVGNSVVVHKRARQGPVDLAEETDLARIKMHFFWNRNVIYLLRMSGKKFMFLRAIQHIARGIVHCAFAGPYRFLKVKTIISGCICGLFFNPRK